MQAGRFDSVVVTEELKTAKLSRSLVGSKRDELMATSNGQSVLNVCREFGKFVKYVELRDAQPPPPATASNRCECHRRGGLFQRHDGCYGKGN